MTNLRIPGPTPCRDEIAKAVSRPMMNYRGPEMAEFLDALVDKLKRYLDTSHDVLLLTASGTGGLEAAVANTLRPGDRVVAVSAGVFGERFCKVAEAYGVDVRRLSVEWGKAVEPDALRRVLREEQSPRAVLLTHSETSTGILHPVEALAEVVRSEADCLLLVDGVSSLGAVPLAVESLGIDIVISGSQKAWGVPPGMALLALSPRAWEAADEATLPRFYFDLRRYRDAQKKGSFPFTPALPVLYGLDQALDLMLAEGRDAVFARHRRVAERAREGLQAMGLTLFADPDHASPTVTAACVPPDVDEKSLVELLRTKYDTVYARGQERLMGKILRLGHLGWVEEPEIEDALRALRSALDELGYAVSS